MSSTTTTLKVYFVVSKHHSPKTAGNITSMVKSWQDSLVLKKVNPNVHLL